MRKEKQVLLKKTGCFILLFLFIFTFTACKKNDDEYVINKNLDLNKEVNLRISNKSSDWEEMDYVIDKFETIYPNCTITIEYLEKYENNLKTRLEQTESKIDIFRSKNIQESVVWKDCALNLISEESKEILDLSKCYDGLVRNFEYTSAENEQYAIPFGGEMRGLYVNVTLLKKYNLTVPKNREELLNCCKVLKENGYIPFQSDYGSFGQQLLYPYICNSIVNSGKYEETYNAVENIDEGISENFRDAYSFMYDIVEKGYYDFEKGKETYGYKFNGSTGKAKDFLDIMQKDDDVYEKKSDVGNIAFLTDTQAFAATLDKTKDDYHSEIEYQFIVSPVGTDGGYAYLSPSDGLAINKNSDNIEWSLEFLNFFFTKKMTTEFARIGNIIPNNEDALIKYDIEEDHACDVGQVTFSYTFYKTVTTLLGSGYDSYLEVDNTYISSHSTEKFYYKDGSSYKEATSEYRSINPEATIYRKYKEFPGMGVMNDKDYMELDGSTYKIKFTLEEYMDRLEEEFQKVKGA